MIADIAGWVMYGAFLTLILMASGGVVPASDRTGGA